MTTMASQITSLTVVYSTIYADADQRKIKAPCHWPMCGEFTGTDKFPAQRPVTRKMFPFHDVIMLIRHCLRIDRFYRTSTIYFSQTKLLHGSVCQFDFAHEKFITYRVMLINFATNTVVFDRCIHVSWLSGPAIHVPHELRYRRRCYPVKVVGPWLWQHSSVGTFIVEMMYQYTNYTWIGQYDACNIILYGGHMRTGSVSI